MKGNEKSDVLTSYTVQDWILFLAPVLSASQGLNLPGLIPGTTGFLISVVIAALAKSVSGLGQDHSIKNYEDWLQFIITLVGLIGTGLTASPQFVLYGTIIGFIAKSLPSLKNGFNVEDVLLFLGSLLSLYGTYTGGTAIANVGLLISTVGKSIPSIANPSQA